MRRRCLIAERALARQQVLDEDYYIRSSNRAQVDRPFAEAVIEKAIGEAERVVDGARAEAPLLDEIGLVVGEQRSTCDLRVGQRRR